MYREELEGVLQVKGEERMERKTLGTGVVSKIN